MSKVFVVRKRRSQSVPPKVLVSDSAPTEQAWKAASVVRDVFSLSVPESNYAYVLSAHPLEFVDQYGLLNGWDGLVEQIQIGAYRYLYRTNRSGLGQFFTRIRRLA